MDAPNEIVVADDEAAMRHLLARALERWGFAVTPCADGQEALRAVASREGRALLLLDYAMPGLNGAEVCQVIRAHGNPLVAQTPIILLTAHAGERQELECLRAGADDFVPKPVHLPVLRARLNTHRRLAALRARQREQNQELAAWRALHEEDLAAAALIQRALVPQNFPPVQGWRFALAYQPLIQVGGDSLGALPLKTGGTLTWIADATGHGVAAALVTTLLSLLFRHALETKPGGEPALVLEGVNREFIAIFHGRAVLTAACARLQPESGAIQFAGAGHTPALAIRPGHGVEVLESLAPPIGLPSRLSPRECEESLELHPGEGLLLFTDGLYGRGPFSMPGLVRTLEGTPPEDPNTAIQTALGAARLARGNRPFDDDVALAALWREPPQPASS